MASVHLLCQCCSPFLPHESPSSNVRHMLLRRPRREDGAELQPLNDTFVLDTQTLQWRWPTVSSGIIPAARNAATMNGVGGRLVLHGGWDPFKTTYNDTFLLCV